MINVIIAQHSFNTDTGGYPGPYTFPPAWWSVDLGASYDVYQVVIVNR